MADRVVAAVGFVSWIRIRRAAGAEPAEPKPDENHEAGLAAGAPAAPIEIRLGSELSMGLAPRQEILLDRIAASRRTLGKLFGLSFPNVRIKEDPELGGIDYEIVLQDLSHGGGQLYLDRSLAIRQNSSTPRIEGIPGRDPAFGLEGVWIELQDADAAAANGYSVIEPETVLMTHLTEILKADMASLLSRALTVELLDQARGRQPGLVEELIPNVMTVSDVQRVLQGLLRERVSIGNLDLVLETLVDIGRQERDPAELTERVRQKLGVAICNALRGHHDELAVLSLDPRIENRIVADMGSAGSQNLLGVDPRLAEQLLQSLAPMVDRMIRQGRSPVLLCAGTLRRVLLRLTQRTLPQLSVISVDEIPLRINLTSFDVVRLEKVPAQ